MKSWFPIPPDSDFSIYNLPFGIFSTPDIKHQAGIALGDFVIDLFALAEDHLIEVDKKYFEQPYLNDFIALGKPTTSAVRRKVQQLFSEEQSPVRDLYEKYCIPIQAVDLRMPIQIGDYTDFYSSLDHATNMGKMFRDPDKALLPNWKHIPVGYHGRASSVVISGTPIHRPKGQLCPDESQPPVFGPTKSLDIELEVAFVTGKESKLGHAIPMEETEDYIFGLMLFNDLSARDIQKWEYVPLGPFLGKNFGSILSPWIVCLEALEPFRVDGYVQSPEVLPYLKYQGKKNYDIQLEVYLKTEKSEEKKIIHSNFKYMYWNMCQQLAHHTVNGCNVRVADLMASGTISGPEMEEFGSLMELSWKGTRPIVFANGEERRFLQDGDTVSIRGYAQKEGMRVGFGECSTRILPAI